MPAPTYGPSPATRTSPDTTGPRTSPTLNAVTEPATRVTGASASASSGTAVFHSALSPYGQCIQSVTSGFSPCVTANGNQWSHQANMSASAVTCPISRPPGSASTRRCSHSETSR
ncbi:hypothetical protein HX744_29150 [Pseudonocardia sp. ICBG1122]|nr:hypothetical protein [Pseudonocardia pini]